ncbi:MAG TPA: peptidyl-prolyl cis-trans isomerase [Thermoanaerobaculia bacterium]|jgi:parvulin-like peptidyl-prolyl isomerase
MAPRRILAILLTTLALAAACKKKPATPPDVVVRVGERMLTLADFKRYLDRNAGTDLAQMSPEVASAMLDQYVDEIILSERAALQGVEVPADKIASAVRSDAGSTVVEKRDQMRREQLIANLAAEMPEPSEPEVRAYYDQHVADFRSDEEVRVRQILVHDETLANEIVAKLKGGADFGTLSAEHSSAPNAKRGGEIGFVSRGELPKMFENEIFRLQPGQVSDVIRTDSTFHVFRVDERRAAGQVDLQTAAPVIRQRIQEDAIRNRVAQLVSQSRRDMQVAVLTKRLPFKYSGALATAANE